MIFRKDPCGIICVVFTYGLIIYADYVVIAHIVLLSMSGTVWGALHSVLFNLLIFIQIFAHTKTVISDPGIVPLPKTGLDFSDARRVNSKPNELQALTSEDWTVCQRCDTYRPPRSHHCKICKRCIRKMDHHCPWVNNCIGEKNQKYFIQFLFYTGILCVYAMSLDIVSWVFIFRASSPQLTSVRENMSVAHSIALCIESLLFGLFVVAMLCDQFSSIVQDETGIEHVINQKKPRQPRPRKPKMALIREVFDYSPIYCWFFPCSTGSKNRKETSFSYDV